MNEKALQVIPSSLKYFLGDISFITCFEHNVMTNTTCIHIVKHMFHNSCFISFLTEFYNIEMKGISENAI